MSYNSQGVGHPLSSNLREQDNIMCDMGSLGGYKTYRCDKHPIDSNNLAKLQEG